MAAVTTRQAPVLPPPSGRAGFGGTLRSEFTKIRSVRSTYWTLLVLLAVSIGIGAAICAGTAANWDQTSAADRATFDATQVSIAGLFYLGQLVIVVFGAIVLTAEYSTGMIRTSLTAMPRRVTVYAAKALVFAVVALVVTLIAAFVDVRQFVLVERLIADAEPERVQGAIAPIVGLMVRREAPRDDVIQIHGRCSRHCPVRRVSGRVRRRSEISLRCVRVSSRRSWGRDARRRTMPQHASSIRVCGEHQYMISQCTNRASNPKSSGRTGKC